MPIFDNNACVDTCHSLLWKGSSYRWNKTNIDSALQICYYHMGYDMRRYPDAIVLEPAWFYELIIEVSWKFFLL